ncbi:hypothetical protein CBS11852_3560 [Aspergillus niger]|nr:hypothetical protein CBS11852_3560 [Aspergillus niger]
MQLKGMLSEPLASIEYFHVLLEVPISWGSGSGTLGPIAIAIGFPFRGPGEAQAELTCILTTLRTRIPRLSSQLLLRPFAASYTFLAALGLYVNYWGRLRLQLLLHPQL